MSMYSRFWFYIKILYGMKTIKTFGQDNKLNLQNLCFDFSTCVPVVMATCLSHHSHDTWHCAVQQHNGKLHLTYVHPWIPYMRLFSHSLLVCGCVCHHMTIWFADTIAIVQPMTSWAVEPVVEIKKCLAYGGDVLGFMCGDDKQTQNEERNASSLLKSPLGERLHIYSAARGLIAAVHLNQEETLSTTGRWRIHSYHFIILLFLKKTFLTHSVSPWLLLFHNIL